MENRWENSGNSDRLYFGGAPKSLQMVTIKRRLLLGRNLKNDRMISVHYQGKPFNITVIQVYALTSNTEEAEVEQFYEDLQDLLELTHKKDVLLGD